MTRPEIEKVINTRKNLAPTTILSLLTRLEAKNFVEVTKQGKMNLYTPLISQTLYQGKKISSEEIHELSDFLKEMEDREE